MATNAREPGPLTQAVAEEIRVQLGRRKWKQADLVKATGMPKATISSLVNGNSAIDVEQLASIGEALNIDPGEIVRNAMKSPDYVARRRGSDPVYLPDGRLNPANTRGVPPSDDILDEVTRRKGDDSSG
ncbi:helix-turn-helix domain-containing protein [Nocardia sp. N2S4-5]|uniref:helix-turn-helix domain-containing protein n=1 Tax=Nocardia sp. N2S4-5 TaxID=3351565 RepID=UPI0037D0E0F8